MTSPTSFETAEFSRITAGDILRWAAAAILITTTAGAGVMAMQRWTPAAATQLAPEPAMLIDLAPLPEPVAEPEPEPIIEPPPPEPVPEIAQPPVVPPIAPQPLPEPPLVEPEVIPLPEPEPVVQPEPEHAVEPEPEPLPEPVLEPVVSDMAMPVMMSPELRQRREETPATPRPQRNPPPRKPAAEPVQQQQPRPQQPAASQPAAQAAPRISPEQWQSQVLRRLDQRKVYPRAAQARGESGAVIISFAVDAGGRVSSVGVARSSGSPELDQAAVETARRASPLPRPPAGFAGQSLSASIRFTLR